jgi:hypothetical protein
MDKVEASQRQTPENRVSASPQNPAEEPYHKRFKKLAASSNDDGFSSTLAPPHMPAVITPKNPYRSSTLAPCTNAQKPRHVPRLHLNTPEAASDNLLFIAFKTTASSNESSISWTLFDSNGVALQKHQTCFQIQDVNLSLFFSHVVLLPIDGYVVAFDFQTELEFVVQHAEADEKFIWENVKNCNLSSLMLQRLVDIDLFSQLDIDALHNLVCGDLTKIKTADDVLMAGQIFYWLYRNHDTDLLSMAYTVDSRFPRTNFKLASKLKGWIHACPTGPWDAPEECKREFKSPLKYVVVDVETHDWTNGIGIVTRDNCIGKIVEMSWKAYDDENSLLEKKCYLLKPYGYERIADKARNFHRITTKLACEQGCDSFSVFREFINLDSLVPQDGFVICHNMNHEDAVFATNLRPYQVKVWDRVQKCCTCDPRLLKHFYPEYSHRKFGMKLGDLYQKVARSVDFWLLSQAHSSIADVSMTWEIFHHFKTILQRDQGDEWRRIMQWRGPPLSNAGVAVGRKRPLSE